MMAASSSASSSSSRRRRRQARSLAAEVAPLVAEQARLVQQLAALDRRIEAAERRKRRRERRARVVESQLQCSASASASASVAAEPLPPPPAVGRASEGKEEQEQEQEQEEEEKEATPKKKRRTQEEEEHEEEEEKEEASGAGASAGPQSPPPICFYPPATQDTLSSQSQSQAAETPPRVRRVRGGASPQRPVAPAAPRAARCVEAAVVARLHQRAAVRVLRLGRLGGRAALIIAGDAYLAVWRSKAGGAGWARSCLVEAAAAPVDAVWVGERALVVFADRAALVGADGAEAGEVRCRDAWRAFTCALAVGAELCVLGTASGAVVWVREGAVERVADAPRGAAHKVVSLFHAGAAVAAMLSVGSVLVFESAQGAARVLEPRREAVSAVLECAPCGGAGAGAFVEGHAAALLLVARPKFAGVSLVDARPAARWPLLQRKLPALPQVAPVGPLLCLAHTAPPLGVAALRSGTLRLVSCLTGQRLAELTCHKGAAVTSLSGLGEDALLASGDDRGRVFLHSVIVE